MNHMNIEDYLYLELESGIVVIQLFPELAPQHVTQIRYLVEQKFYDGLLFHRVIDGFMVQTGCPHGTGAGGVTPTIPAEFSEEKHVRGTCSMARTQDPDSASCQFFICLADTPSLDGQYSIWGQVVEGMEFIDSIKKGDQVNNGTVEDPDHIVAMYRAGSVPVSNL